MNLLASIPDALPVELAETLVTSGHVRIERIVSRGHVSPPGFWYDQSENEWVLLVWGAARMRFEEETIDLKPGDTVNIPAHKRHRVEWTAPDEATIWLAVYYE